MIAPELSGIAARPTSFADELYTGISSLSISSLA